MKYISILFIAVGMFSFAQDSDTKAASIDDLLKMVQQGKARETKENKERETNFMKAKKDQARLLKNIKNKRASEERRSERLETSFERNELKTADLTETLNKRLGTLKELFGVLQQVAGDTSGLFEESLTSTQYAGRSVLLDEFAKKMGKSSQIASIEEIEWLWFELQREMTESGKVSRFQATVERASGGKATMDVVRIGTFNLISDGSYLKYENGQIRELGRQPQPRFIATTNKMATVQSGSVKFGIDPSRGSILSLLVQAPSLRERIDQGGIIGYLIIALGILGVLIALERLLILMLASRKVTSQLKKDKPDKGNALGRVLLVFDKYTNSDRETVELKISEAIFKELPALGRGLTFLKIISVVAPLMGLLGTVTGMINTFQAITLFGTGDPKLMAGGISQALVTTVLGLCVAIPTLLMHTLVNSRSNRIVHVLEEQSAGIIAEHSEHLGSKELS